MAGTDNVRWRSAVFEGVAVLVGILVAFGVDASWDLRKEREETRASLTAVRSELESNRDQIKSDIEYIGRTIEETYTTLERVAAPGATPTYDETAALLQEITPKGVRQLSQVALNDLQSSGAFAQIESVELRLALGRYQSALADDERTQEGRRQFFDDFLHPYDVTEGSIIAKNPSWYESIGVPELRIDLPLPMEPYVGNRVYANLLTARMFVYSAVRQSRQSVLERIDEVLKVMDGAI
jgi:hypothetical protein